jgi:6-pyruvoyltetrahydropterin/6-carboxytetrahydropterin synthase
MFTVSIETQFKASHQLSLSDGSKEPLHHHDWQVIAEVSSRKLNVNRVVMDFRLLKAMVDNIVKDLNNKILEKIDYFQGKNCSAETIAAYIYEKLEPALPDAVRLESTSVIEGPGCLAKFSKS